MMNNELNTIILETLNNADITSNDIPSIDLYICLLYTSPSPRDRQKSRMPSSA
ncbi:hypothetical protein CDFC105_93911 [Clostridioides difficile]|nr:hypothetical protein CDFC105_93911 [Clostridioides difficile]